MNETILPRAILMDLKTGQQFEVNLQSDINPWPTEPDEEEPAQPMVFNKTVNFKLPKKDSLVFKRMLRRQNKVPRKLKKALKHVGFFQLPMERIETENGFAFKQTVGFGPKDGYPCTKWVNRACIKLQANAILIAKRQISAENYKQRGPHSYLLPTTSYLQPHNSQPNNSKLPTEMKITYPECQIEISTEEIIDLLNHFIESTSSRKHEIQEDPSVESTSSRQHESTEVRKSLYKTICCPECGHKFKEEVPDFMNGEFDTKCPNCGTKISGVRAGNEIVIMTLPPKEQEDEQPAPKPYPNMLDHEAIIQRKYSGFYDIIKKALEEAEAQGKLPEELTQVEIPKEDPHPSKSR